MMLALSLSLACYTRGTRCCLLQCHKSAQLCMVFEYLVMLLAMRHHDMKALSQRLGPTKTDIITQNAHDKRSFQEKTTF